MKFLKITTLLVILLFSLTACNTSKVTVKQTEIGKQTETGKKDPQGITVNKINFEQAKDEELPPNMDNSIRNLKPNKGFLVYDYNGYYYITIFAGKKNTGGYSIKVLSIEDNEGKTFILVEEKSPSKDDIVTQVITYPYTTIKVRGITPNITIENEGGEKYERLLKEGDIY